MRTKGIGGIYAMEDKPKSKCRKWKIKISVGINPATGKYAQRAMTFHGSYTEAVQAREDFKRKLLGMSHAESKKMTLSQCCELWLDTADPFHQLSENARYSRQCAVKAVCHCIGALPVSQITDKHVVDMVKGWIDGKTLSGRRYSGNTINIYCSALSGMMTHFAIPKGYASRNPFAGYSSVKKDQREVNAISVKQFERLAYDIYDQQDPRCMALLLALLAGCRANEALAVQWKDIQGGFITIKGTKSKAANATLPMIDTLADMLAMWRVTQANNMKALQLTQTPETYVSTNLIYEQESYSTLNRAWKKLGSELGFDDPRPHDLRHWFVSYLCMSDMNIKAIQQMARHSDITTTMDIYARIHERDLAAETAKIQRFGADSSQTLSSADEIRSVFSV